MKKISLALLLALLLVFGAVACSDPSGTSSSQTPDTSTNQTATYPLTITDANGVEVTIDKEPERIISTTPGITEIIYALGAGDKLVGRSDYCNYPAQALEIPSVGEISPPDVERIAELSPDLIIASTHGAELGAAFSELDITVLPLFEEGSFDGAYTLVEKVGKVLNCEAKAAGLVAEMKDTVKQVTELVAGLDKPSVYYVVDFGEYGDFTAGGDTFIGKAIQMAGGNNIAKELEGWMYNLESLIEADPEIIIISKNLDAKDKFMNFDAYKELTAVKEGKVYEIDDDMLVRQGVRNPEGLKELAKIIHPEVFE